MIGLQSQHMPHLVFHVSSCSHALYQSQSPLISHKMPLAGKLFPSSNFLFLSLFNQCEPSCLQPGKLPVFKMFKDHKNMFQISSLVFWPKLYLPCKTVKGTLSGQLWHPGKLTVMKSKDCFLIVPKTGTASPCKPTGTVPSAGKPACRH